MRKEGLLGEMGEKMGEKMSEKMGEKMGEKRGEDQREPVTYRIRSPRQNAEDGAKQPEGRKRSHA
jgi:hypothetical protein